MLAIRSTFGARRNNHFPQSLDLGFLGGTAPQKKGENKKTRFFFFFFAILARLPGLPTADRRPPAERELTSPQVSAKSAALEAAKLKDQSLVAAVKASPPGPPVPEVPAVSRAVHLFVVVFGIFFVLFSSLWYFVVLCSPFFFCLVVFGGFARLQ